MAALTKEEIEKKDAKAQKLKAMDDWCSGIITGGACTLQMHPYPSDLQIMLLLKHIRIRMPHLTSDPIMLEHEIAKEAKKL